MYTKTKLAVSLGSEVGFSSYSTLFMPLSTCYVQGQLVPSCVLAYSGASLRQSSLTSEFQALSQFQVGYKFRVILGGNAVNLSDSAVKSEKKKIHEKRQLGLLCGGKFQQFTGTFQQGHISLGATEELKENMSESTEMLVTIIPPYCCRYPEKSKSTVLDNQNLELRKLNFLFNKEMIT